MEPEITQFNWRRHSRDVIEFQRETYRLNFPDFVADQRFLHDFGAELRKAVSNPSEGLYVLEQDGRAQGFLWLSLIGTIVEPCIGYIRNIYVSSRLRGHGHGKRLMAFAESWFAARGVNRLSLDASCCNEAAMALYRQCGYEVVRVRMEKQLSPGTVPVQPGVLPCSRREWGRAE